MNFISFNDLLLFSSENFYVISLITAIISIIFAVVVFSFKNKMMHDEPWVNYFAWFFIVFTFQYFFQWFEDVLSPLAKGNEFLLWLLKTLGLIARCLGSVVNNLLIFAAARSLLAKKAPFPHWVILLSIISFLPYISARYFMSEAWYSRLAVGFFSAFCLAYFGFAMFKNLNPFGWRIPLPVKKFSSSAERKDFFFAWGVFSICIIYALINLSYVLNPQYSMWFTLPKDTDIDPLKANDAFTFLLSFLMKLLLFMGVLFFMIRSTLFILPQTAKTVMERVGNSRVDYFLDGRILETISTTMKATGGELCYWDPGERAKVISLRWDSGTAPSYKPQLFEELGHSVRFPFDTSEPYCNRPALGFVATVEKEEPTLVVPVRFHGAVIGALKLNWEHLAWFTPNMLHRLKFFADFLAPAIDAHRQIKALAKMAEGFQWAALQSPNYVTNEAMRSLSRILYNHLAPLSLGMVIKFGFPNIPIPIFGQNGQSTINHSEEDIDIAAQVRRKSGKPLEMLEMKNVPLVFEGVDFGRLYLTFHKGRDEVQRPTLGSDWLFNSVVGTLVVEGFLTGVRNKLWVALNDLQIELEKNKISDKDGWYKIVKAASEEVGFCQVAVHHRETMEFQGEPNFIDLVKNLGTPEKEYKHSFTMRHFRLDYSANGVPHILEMDLPVVQARLWLGIERRGFGPELEFSTWPWRIFLGRFGEAAGFSLARMDVQRLREEALEMQSLDTMSLTLGSLVHQLNNLTTSLSFALHGLKETLGTPSTNGIVKGENERLGKRLNLLSEAITELRELTHDVLDAHKVDSHKPCTLNEAAIKVERSFRETLVRKKIKLTIDLAEPFTVDQPFHVISSALANLVSNSIEAIKADGEIHITARNSGETVKCVVRDTGPGIPAEKEKEIFKANYSTRKSGHGLGLWFTRKSLKENRGNVALTHNERGHCEFTLTLPMPRPVEAPI